MDHTVNDRTAAIAKQARVFFRRHLSWLLGGALALLLLQDIFGTHGLIAMHRSRQEAVRVQKEINQINEENQQLEGRVKDLKSDPAAIERIARQEMGLARPGEYIFKIPPKTSGPADNGSAPADPSRKP